MGMVSSSHKHASCTSQSNFLMTKIVTGVQWKCDTHSRFNNPTISTPCNHLCGSNSITSASMFFFSHISCVVSKCGNFSWFARS